MKIEEIKKLARLAIVAGEQALAGNGQANDYKIVIGDYVNDFGSFLSPKVAAASIVESLVKKIDFIPYKQPDHDESCEVLEMLEAWVDEKELTNICSL